MTTPREGSGLLQADDQTSALTHARRAEQLAQLSQRITALANESVEVEESLRHAARDICETMGWSAGQAVTVGDDGSLLAAGTVHVRGSPEDGDLLHRATDDGGPLRAVVTSARAVWAGELRDTDRDPARAAPQGWLGFPVTVDTEVVAVLHFLSGDDADPDTDLLETMAAVGRQLGVLIERNQARQWLEEVNAELTRSNQELERFAYIASHDLQEPLRKIVGFAELLEQRYDEELTGEASEFLGYVTDGAYRMRELIQDLLAYFRVGRRQPEMRPTELADVVDAAVGDVEHTIAETGANVTLDGPLPRVGGNASELRELVVNLLSNAMKYRGDEPPEITISAGREADDWWRLTVADNGMGIDPQHHERIFDVFQRLHGHGRYEGTGIGLAVCRRIADHHGGRIWVESKPGGGASFHLTLPPAPDTGDRTERDAD